MKKIFVIDWSLVAAFFLTAVSGIGLHLAGHHHSYEIWEVWAVTHSVMSIVSLLLVVWHIKHHWAWYKGILSKGLKNKKATPLLLSLIIVVVSVSGLLQFGIRGALTDIGIFHYAFGLALLFVSALHVVGRAKVLRKSLK